MAARPSVTIKKPSDSKATRFMNTMVKREEEPGKKISWLRCQVGHAPQLIESWCDSPKTANASRASKIRSLVDTCLPRPTLLERIVKILVLANLYPPHH